MPVNGLDLVAPCRIHQFESTCDDRSYAKPIDVVQLSLPSLLHFGRLELDPDYAPKMRLWSSTVTRTGCNSLESAVVAQRQCALAHESSSARKLSAVACLHCLPPPSHPAVLILSCQWTIATRVHRLIRSGATRVHRLIRSGANRVLHDRLRTVSRAGLCLPGSCST